MNEQLPPPTNATGPPCAWWEVEPAELSEVARRRRDEIMDAAEAVIAGQGIDKLSLAQIEARADMSRGQLTYYFPSKESILLAVYDRMLRRMIREFLAGEGPKPMTGRAWDCFRHALGRHLEPSARRGSGTVQPAVHVPGADGAPSDYREKLAEMYRGWREHIAADVSSSVTEPRPVSPRIAASLVQALLQGLEIQLMIDPEAFDRAEMLDACARLMAPAFRQDAASAAGES